jgi:hypothetical protein
MPARTRRINAPSLRIYQHFNSIMVSNLTPNFSASRLISFFLSSDAPSTDVVPGLTAMSGNDGNSMRRLQPHRGKLRSINKGLPDQLAWPG